MADDVRYVGGQAVLEGVMMRGESSYAVAVRNPAGEIELEVRDAPRWSQKVGKVPFVTGRSLMLIEPSARRTATANELGERIITPSRTA